EKITVANMDSLINKGSTSFGLQVVNDAYMLFSSARTDERADSLVGNNRNPLEYYLLDIYLVKINPDGSLGTAGRFPFEITASDYHEGSAVTSSDGNPMFFTKTDPHNRNAPKTWVSRRLNSKWMPRRPMEARVNM